MKKFILLGIIILSFIVQGNNQIFKSNSKEYFIIKGKNIVNQKRLVTSLDKSNSKYEILIGLDHPNGTILNLKNQENKKIIGMQINFENTNAKSVVLNDLFSDFSGIDDWINFAEKYNWLCEKNSSIYVFRKNNVFIYVNDQGMLHLISVY